MTQHFKTVSEIHRGKLFFIYCALHTAYWGMVCAVSTFAAVLLLSKGFTSSRIGVVMAAGNMLAALLQPSITGIADHSKKITLHRLIFLFSLGGGAIYLLTVLPNRFPAVILASFILSYAIMGILQPLVNSISVYYTNRGVDLDFGKGRGVGSISYAVTSTLLGLAVDRFGTGSIIAAGSVLFVLTAVMTLVFPLIAEEAKDMELAGNAGPCPASADAATAPAGSPDSRGIENAGPAGRRSAVQSGTGFFDFIRKYPSFMIVLAGIVSIHTFHTMSNNYLSYIIVRCGGSTSEMGIALSVAAMVELPAMFGFSILIKKFGSRKLLVFAALFFFCKSTGLWAARSVMGVYLAQSLQMLSFAVYLPASVYFTNEAMDPQDTFHGQGYLTAASTLGGVLGSLLGGFLLERIGVSAMNSAGMILTAFAVIMIFWGTRKDRTSRS